MTRACGVVVDTGANTKTAGGVIVELSNGTRLLICLVETRVGSQIRNLFTIRGRY
jgi:hypothetical protein